MNRPIDYDECLGYDGDESREPAPEPEPEPEADMPCYEGPSTDDWGGEDPPLGPTDLYEAIRAHIAHWKHVDVPAHNRKVARILEAEEYGYRKGYLTDEDMARSRARKITCDHKQEARAWQDELSSLRARGPATYDDAAQQAKAFPRLRGFVKWHRYAVEYLAHDEYYHPFDIE